MNACICGFYPEGLTPPAWHTCQYRETREFSTPLDPGVERYVNVLLDNGVETYESCQGGAGHSSPYPVVRFHGNRAEGLRAVAIAQAYGLPIFALHRVWRVENGDLTGPNWEMEFRAEVVPNA